MFQAGMRTHTSGTRCGRRGIESETQAGPSDADDEEHGKYPKEQSEIMC
jgi:hypothetical protein